MNPDAGLRGGGRRAVRAINSCTVSGLVEPETSITLTRQERNALLTTTQQRQDDLESLNIHAAAIRIYSYEEMQAIKSCDVKDPKLSGHESVNDPRMGVDSVISACNYCGLIDCPGHYGLINFNTPIYNPIYYRVIVQVLNSVCNSCGRMYLTAALLHQYGIDRLPTMKRLQAIEKRSEDLQCPHNNSRTGAAPCGKKPVYIVSDMKKTGVLKYKEDKTSSTQHLISVDRVRMILEMISPEDCALLGFPADVRPSSLIMRGILVMPIIARPVALEGNEISQDKLTLKYENIVKVNRDIAAGLRVTSGSRGQSDLYKSVRALFVTTDTERDTGGNSTIMSRIQGKSGMPRHNMMGKRVNYCARTVAGPEPSLQFGQFAIPQEWASTITKKIRINQRNLQEVIRYIQAGQVTHITPKATGLRTIYKSYLKTKVTYTPAIGDVVERVLMDGDLVFVNRQPTLHRQSMMAYRAVLMPYSTMRSHLSYTTPMNCDYDGDENNLWQILDGTVEAEALILMNVQNNVMSTEQNRASMGLVMNSITGAYMLTNAATLVRPNLREQLLNMMSYREDLDTLEARLAAYEVNPLSGRAIFSALLPADFYYQKKGVVIINGILLKGQIKKSHVGPSSRSIIQELWKKYGATRTSAFLTDAPWVINKWLMERGFSVGLLDVLNLQIDTATGKEYDANVRLLKSELAQVYVQIEALGQASTDVLEENYRQRRINNLVNIARSVGVRLSKDVLSKDNSIGVMTEEGAGTKGGLANIGQIMGSVGQQYYRGARLKPQITNRSRLLPTYDPYDNQPEAHGFIPQSFFTGLTPQGLFFLQSAGREGLMDTALKTADTGSLQHMMGKAFENIVVAYDGSIRNTAGIMFTTCYNAGYDPSEMIALDEPGKDNFSSFIDLQQTVNELNASHGWIQDSDKEILNTENVPPIRLPDPIDISHIRRTVPKKITKYEKARIIGARTIQLNNNAPPLIPLNEPISDLEVAVQEYEAGVLPIYVIRKINAQERENIYPTLDNI